MILFALGSLVAASLPQAAPAPMGPVQVDPEGAPPQARVEWFHSARPAATRRTDIAADAPGAPATQRTASSTFVGLNLAPEGDMPRDVAFTPDGSRVLVCNRDTDNVTVFDFATRDLLATVPVGDFPVDVEVSPDGTLAAVPNVLSGTVSFIDLATLSVVATVPVTQTTGEGEPYSVRWDDASSFCLVAVIDGSADARFSVISRATLTETSSFTTSPHGAVGFFLTPESGIFGNVFSDFAMSGDGSFLLLPDRAGDALNAYALPGGALLASLPVGDGPAYIDLSDDATAAVVSLGGATDAVVALSVSGGVPTILSTTPTNATAFDPQVRLTPDKTEAIVAVQNAVEFIDLGAGQVVATVTTGIVGDIQFTFDDQFAVVTNFNTRVIRLSTRSQVASIAIAPTADAAVSPVSHRLVGINNRFAEDLHFYSTNGSASQGLGVALSGEEPEIDAPRRVTVTPDGRTALIAGLTSRRVAAFDLDSRTVANTYGVGSRVWEIDTDAAGTVAVVTSTESNRVDVIDLVAQQSVAQLSIGTRPTQVAVSDDGTRAYVTTIAGTDRVHFIDLAGAASAVTGTLVAGQLGSIQFANGQSSGIALSPDGNTLAVCVSFDDELLLIDTVSETEIARVPVGDFPIRCAWSPDGARVFVTNTFGNSVSRVDFNGAASSVSAVAPGQDGCFEVRVDDAGAFLYVSNRGQTNRGVAVIDAGTMQQVASATTANAAFYLELAGSNLFASVGDEVYRLRAAGAATAIVDSVEITTNAAGFAFSPARGTTIATDPGVNDGINLSVFGGVPVNECGPAAVNSTGLPGRMESDGAYLAGGLPLSLRAVDLPNFSFGYFLHSDTPGLVMNPGGSQGDLCLGGTIGRFNTLAQNSGANGTIEIQVDTLNLPSVPMSVAILPGDTWSFQLWYRDANPGVTSNFTDRLTVTFE